jgi:hypothetical protein
MSKEKQNKERNELLNIFAPSSLSFEEACILTDEIIETGYRKQKWISVDERLPEIEGDARTWGELKIRKSVRVLCACLQKSGKTFVKEGYCEVWGDSQRAYWKIPGSIDKVTHWMPLPEAPKMKGGAE